MKTLLKISFLLLFFGCKAQSKSQPDSNLQFDHIKTKVEKLERKNDSLERKINDYNTANDSVIGVIDKVDNLYNNNFTRFIAFWAIVASLIIIGIPYYINRMQNKILEAKKAEILVFSKKELTKLENKFTSKLKEKYIELNDLINYSNESNKENLKKEMMKSMISNLYIASKINEIDKRYDSIFTNLSNAVIKSNSIGYYDGVKFHLNNISTTLAKLRKQHIVLNADKLQTISTQLKTLRNIEEIDQNLLEKVINEIG